MAGNPRNMRIKRARFRAQVLAIHGATCWRCTKPIDLTLKFPHKQSYTADHVPEHALLLEQGLDPFNPAYGRPAHLSCNSSAGATFGNQRRNPSPSRDWYGTTDLTW